MPSFIFFPPPFLLSRLSGRAPMFRAPMFPSCSRCGLTNGKMITMVSGLCARTLLHTMHMSVLLTLTHVSLCRSVYIPLAPPFTCLARSLARSRARRALSLSFQIAAMSGIQGADEVSPSPYSRQNPSPLAGSILHLFLFE